MELLPLLTLVGAGLAAGFIAGLLGVGGGVIFAPVLFFFFESIGVDALAITPLTLGTSLFCTLLASVVSGYFHFKKGAVVPSVALKTGLLSAVTVVLMTRYVTTQPWYDGRAFQIVFGVLLILISIRMVVETFARDPTRAAPPSSSSWPPLIGISALVGIVATAAGVGGGVVMVPAYARFLGLPMKTSIGTSSASIVLISAISTLTYVVSGLGASVPSTALGYVDFGHAVALAVPAIFTARLGVATAHRTNTGRLKWAFAGLAILIALRLIVRAAG
jgi:hypothetical protein